jgi:hypothetical protein
VTRLDYERARRRDLVAAQGSVRVSPERPKPKKKRKKKEKLAELGTPTTAKPRATPKKTGKKGRKSAPTKRNTWKPSAAALAIQEFRALRPAARPAELPSYEQRVRAFYNQLERSSRPLSPHLLERRKEQQLDRLRELAGQAIGDKPRRTTRRGVATSEGSAPKAGKKPVGTKKSAGGRRKRRGGRGPGTKAGKRPVGTKKPAGGQKKRRVGAVRNTAAETRQRSRVRLIG